MTPTEVRSAAIAAIEMQGWTQGSYEADGLCLVGALLDAVGALSEDGSPTRAVVDFDEAVTVMDGIVSDPGLDMDGIGDTEDLLVDWNDEAGRTKEEVIAALRGQQS